MVINVSSNCGQSFDQYYLKRRLDLGTEDPTSSPYFPEEATEWRRDSVDLSDLGSSTVVIQFENHSGAGNNLFIDNISIHQTNTSILESDYEFYVYPIPATSWIRLANLPRDVGDLNYTVSDVLGKKLDFGILTSSERFRAIDVTRVPVGIHFLRLEATNFNAVRLIEVIR